MKAHIIGNETASLIGKIAINGSKNSTLTVLAASLLCKEEIQLENIPNIEDVVNMTRILENLGANLDFKINPEYFGNHSITLNCAPVNSSSPCPTLVSKIRASIQLLGPLLGRFGKVEIGMPGGCNLGNRGLDLHFSAFQQMGAKVIEHERYTEVFVEGASGRLHGAVIKLAAPSIGATQNILMAATLAEGTTVIKNASIDPDVLSLSKFLIKMGARIQGAGTRNLTIQGVDHLRGCTYQVIPDHIEAATYATFAIATAGHLELFGVEKKHLNPVVLKKLIEVGGKIVFVKDPPAMLVSRDAKDPIKPLKIATNPCPLFPTDLQPQFCALLCLAKLESGSSSGAVSIVQENVFENRFQHVHELRKLGADIKFISKTAETDRNEADVYSQSKPPSSSSSVIICGSPNGLNGTTVNAHDLRGCAALVLAGLVARGETVIENFQQLVRGYEGMDVKLNACGASIEIIP